ncbi:MAG TPA: hypothetical protein VGW35_05300 [Methylomirabilota bacterium]|nr:hypothetical protein [Methylomirabilota bacterium]
MTPPFAVRTTPRFDRLAKALTPRHLEFPSRYDRARAILAADPYNRGRAYQIKKLEGVQEARWRLSLGRFRFRYDIEGQEVILHYCGLRREDTYD